MKLALFNDNRPGLVHGARIVDLTPILPGWSSDPSFVPRLLGAFDSLRPAIEAWADAHEGQPLEDVELRAPVPEPSQILAAPLNFQDHRDEMQGPLTAGPGTARELGFFLKSPRSVVAPAEGVHLPDLPDRRVDFEAEVAVIIGKSARAVSPAEALDHVFGYSLLLDMTLRMSETQREERTLRKSYATFTPIGPWIVTADEIPDPAAITIKAWRNADLRQDATLADLIVDVPHLVSQASHVMGLEPGDVLAMGSPAGVGQVTSGDVIKVDAPLIGTISTHVTQRDW